MNICWIALLVTTGALASCIRAPSPAIQQIRIATGSKLGTYNPMGRALAEIYNAGVPNVAVSTVETTGSLFNVHALEQGRAELAFSQADVAYFAFQQTLGPKGTQRDAKLRAMAVLYPNVVHIVVRQDGHLHSIKDLSDRRVGVGAHESGTEIVAHLILQAEGLDTKIRAEPATFDEIADAMKRRALDAGFVASYPPVPAIVELSNTIGIRLVSVDPDVVNRVRSKYPFLRPVTIPKGTYKGQDQDVQTMAIDNLLLCRSDLPDRLVHDLTRLLLESSSNLSKVYPAAAAIDPEQAQASPILVHPGAIRAYRERQLLR